MNLFRSSLESKDMYGNEQVSKQHVIQAKICTKYTLKRLWEFNCLGSKEICNRGVACSLLKLDGSWQATPSITKFLTWQTVFGSTKNFYNFVKVLSYFWGWFSMLSWTKKYKIRVSAYCCIRTKVFIITYKSKKNG